MDGRWKGETFSTVPVNEGPLSSPDLEDEASVPFSVAMLRVLYLGYVQWYFFCSLSVLPNGSAIGWPQWVRRRMCVMRW